MDIDNVSIDSVDMNTDDRDSIDWKDDQHQELRFRIASAAADEKIELNVQNKVAEAETSKCPRSVTSPTGSSSGLNKKSMDAGRKAPSKPTDDAMDVGKPAVPQVDFDSTMTCAIQVHDPKSV
ncbi:MAG: hypothetical protein Q9175_004256 [Cornicularia normoerica]